MKYVFTVMLILAIGASFAFASVILADDSIYWETNSRQCKRGDFGKRFINNQGDHCECVNRHTDMSECKRHHKTTTHKPRSTTTGTTTTRSPTSTAVHSTASSTAASKAANYAYWPKRAT